MSALVFLCPYIQAYTCVLHFVEQRNLKARRLDMLKDDMRLLMLIMVRLMFQGLKITGTSATWNALEKHFQLFGESYGVLYLNFFSI